MTSTKTDRDDGFTRLITAVVVTALVLALLAPFALGSGAMLGVAIGGLLAVANLWAIGFVVSAMLRGASLSFGAVAGLKFGALVFVIWVVLKNGWAGAMPLAFGYAALPLGLVIGQLARGLPSRQKV